MKNRTLQMLAGALAAIATFAGSAQAVAKELPGEFVTGKGVKKLAPLAPWNIDFANNRCVLSRLFGTKDEPHLILFDQAAPRARFGMTLAGSGLRKFRPGTWTYLGLLGDRKMQPLSGHQRGTVEGIGQAIFFTDISIAEQRPSVGQAIAAQIDLDQAAKIDRVVLKLGSSGLSWETGNLSPALQALNVCTQDLLVSWGLDPEEHRRYTPPQWENRDRVVGKIVRSYPQKARARGETGIVQMRVIVEADGSVSDCHLEKSTVTDHLESPACEFMQEARFAPALGADGKPIRSFFATSIRYV